MGASLTRRSIHPKVIVLCNELAHVASDRIFQMVLPAIEDDAKQKFSLGAYLQDGLRTKPSPPTQLKAARFKHRRLQIIRSDLQTGQLKVKVWTSKVQRLTCKTTSSKSNI